MNSVKPSSSERRFLSDYELAYHRDIHIEGVNLLSRPLNCGNLRGNTVAVSSDW